MTPVLCFLAADIPIATTHGPFFQLMLLQLSVVTLVGLPTYQLALDQIGKSPKSCFYAITLDSAPYGELLKMDQWVLAYSDPAGMEQGGVVTLTFQGEKLTEIFKGQKY